MRWRIYFRGYIRRLDDPETLNLYVNPNHRILSKDRPVLPVLVYVGGVGVRPRPPGGGPPCYLGFGERLRMIT